VLDVVAVDSNPVVDPKSATSAPRSVTLPATAQRLVATVVDLVATKVDMEADVADTAAVADKVDRPATPAVVTATCPVTAPKAKSVTTAVRSVISPETALSRTTTSVPATSASNQVTFKLNAQTKSATWRDTLRTDE
jgi:hypothetical protein